jgi:N6-L-threonylcarbamoyladenine synthase
MMKSDNLNFSFSGLKTAVLYATRAGAQSDGSLTQEFKRGIALEFELAVAETLEYKLRRAIDQIGAKTVIIGGGVSANSMLRDRFTALAQEYDIPIYLPSRHVSGDNALMIALAGAMNSTGHSDTTGKSLKADGTKRLGAQ